MGLEVESPDPVPSPGPVDVPVGLSLPVPVALIGMDAPEGSMHALRLAPKSESDASATKRVAGVLGRSFIRAISFVVCTCVWAQKSHFRAGFRFRFVEFETAPFDI